MTLFSVDKPMTFCVFDIYLQLHTHNFSTS